METITTEEVWKAIEGYPGCEVSSLGRVRSYRCKKSEELRSEPRLIKPVKRRAYDRVGLYSGGKRTRYSVHRLVMLAFGPPQPPNTEVSHADGNPDNNAITNLVWETHKENLARRSEHGTLPRGENHLSAKLTEQGVMEIRSLWASGNYTQVALGAKFNVTPRNVSDIVRRNSWKHAA